MTETAYDPMVAEEICRQLADGASLREICRNNSMPPESTVRQWVRADRDGFAARFREARALLVERWADEIVEIADNEQLEPNDRRVKIDTRKWLMSKLAPGRYGDRLLHVGDPENPLIIAHERAADNPLDQQQLAAIAHLVEARLGGPVIDVETHPVEPLSDDPD